jgi:hypothetical protein
MEQVFDSSSGSVAIETPGISWGAVLAGAAAACALTLLLLSLGMGLGFAVVSPWGDRGASSTSFEIGTGLYFIVMAMISSGLGGTSPAVRGGNRSASKQSKSNSGTRRMASSPGLSPRSSVQCF